MSKGVGYDDLTTLGREAKSMANKIIEDGLSQVSEYYGSEVMLYYPDLYAGSTDLVCMHDGMETIVDFKQANRPKREEWIEDYYLQIAAYSNGTRPSLWQQHTTRCYYGVHSRFILPRI